MTISPRGIGTIDLAKLIAAGVAHTVAPNFVGPLNQWLGAYQISTPLQVAHFLAQTLHESMRYTRLIENLNYSAKALLDTWPNRFDADTAQLYARKPIRIANYVYANRMGNGPEESGDGWRYRGRGILQNTGKGAYKDLTRETGIDYVNNPDWLTRPDDAVRAACWFWKTRNINSLANLDNTEAVTRRINGGLNGFEDRKALLVRTKTALGVTKRPVA
ncbi:glycoside hydrolase family 19 protein [Larkinella harenae]